MGPPAILWALGQPGGCIRLLVFSPLSSPGLTANVRPYDRQVGRLCGLLLAACAVLDSVPEFMAPC